MNPRGGRSVSYHVDLGLARTSENRAANINRKPRTLRIQSEIMRLLFQLGRLVRVINRLYSLNPRFKGVAYFPTHDYETM
jgi:hypothetical protein